ncbi:hypothetical protein TWF281_009012 [Arthrobotrys megalospora]
MKAFKTFELLLTRHKSPTLDARLFREKPGSVEIKPGTMFQIHPALSSLHLTSLEAYEEGLPLSYTWVFGDLDMAYLRPFDTLPENATSPPFANIIVNFLPTVRTLTSEDGSFDEVERPDLMMEALPSIKGENITVSSVLNASSALLTEFFLTDRQYDGLIREQSNLGIDWESNGSFFKRKGFEYLERFEQLLEAQPSGDMVLQLIPQLR